MCRPDAVNRCGHLRPSQQTQTQCPNFSPMVSSLCWLAHVGKMQHVRFFRNVKANTGKKEAENVPQF